jgi:ribosomal protein S27AE
MALIFASFAWMGLLGVTDSGQPLLWALGLALFLAGGVLSTYAFYWEVEALSYEPHPGTACPRCGRPMTWMEEHRRWFCQHCGSLTQRQSL